MDALLPLDAFILGFVTGMVVLTGAALVLISNKEKKFKNELEEAVASHELFAKQMWEDLASVSNRNEEIEEHIKHEMNILRAEIREHEANKPPVEERMFPSMESSIQEANAKATLRALERIHLALFKVDP